MTDFPRIIIYDKFLIIEGWACRGKALIERRQFDRAQDAFDRIGREMRELKVLLRADSDGK